MADNPFVPFSQPSAPAAPTSGSEAFDYLTGLGTSALSSATELFGIELEGATEFRQENPLMGLFSQLAGAAVPYTGFYKATKLVKPLDQAIRRIGDMDNHPFITGAAREATRFAPFEGGRLVASQVIGDTPLADMAADVGLSLGLGAGIGGLVHGVAAAGTRTAKAAIPGLEVDSPLPLQLRQLRELEATAPPERIGSIRAKMKELDKEIRAEVPPRGSKYVAGDSGLAKQLNRLFDTSKRSLVFDKRRFIQAFDADKAGAFKSEDEWRATAAAAGLPENFPELGQYFREISAKLPESRAKRLASEFGKLDLGEITPEQFMKSAGMLANNQKTVKYAQSLENHLTKQMESLGDGWLLKREADDGLFVMARKFAGEPGKGGLNDRWVLFKTDKPGAFVPGAQRWADVVLEKNSWHAGAAPLSDGGRTYNAARTFYETFTPQNTEVLGKTKGKIGEALAALTPKGLQGKSSEFAGRLRDGAREYLAPTAHQLKKSPLGNHILQTARVAFETADNLAHEVVFGRQATSNKNLFLQSLRGSSALDPNVASFRSILEPLDQATLDDIQKLWRGEVDPERYGKMVLSGEISQKAADAATQLDALERTTWAEYDKLMTALGETPKRPKRGHLGLSRTWEGDSRIALRDDSGRLAAIAAGPTRKVAQANVKRMLEKWPGLHRAEEFDLSQTKHLPTDLRAAVGEPGFLKAREGIRGFKWDFDPWTKDELLEAYGRSQSARMRHMASRSVDDLLKRDMTRLAAGDPVSHRIVQSRINDLAGVQSAGAAWQNRVVDQFLAPMIGTNSATKIVGVTNTAMHTWHLGMGNLSHPILNALTFVQTTLPEAAFVLSGAAEDLAPHYSWFAAGGTRGPVGAMAALDPMKLMVNSMREMAKPRAELLSAFTRAGNEGVTAPRLVEEYIGETATKVSDLRKAFSSGKGFADWLLATSNWLPANSEKLSRVHAFTTGYMIAKDILKIADEDSAYRLAKQFTEKTMFLYQTADRPRIFTTPAGSAMGLFKTWMMNYMAAMLEYSGQAMKGNFAPLAWQTAGTAALGGTAATPLYMIADGFSRAFTGDPLLKTAYDNLSEGSADALMFGLPASITGISLYSQTSSPLANPVRDASMLWTAVTFDRLRATTKTVGLAFDHWQATGEHPGRSDAVRDQLVKALAPSTISRALAAFSGEDMIRSLGTTYPMLDEVSLGDRILYAMKFNPVEIDKAFAVTDELYRDRAKARDQVMKLGRAFAEAQEERDSEQMRQVLRQAAIWGISADRVLRSSRARTERARETQMESTFKAEDVREFRSVLK